MKNKTEKSNERPYRKNEFCMAVCCSWLDSITKSCLDKENNCAWTAKEFHKWLKENNYRIVKNEKNT